MPVEDLSNNYCKLLVSKGYQFKISLWAAAFIDTLSNVPTVKINMVNLKKKDRVYPMNLVISDLTVAIYIITALLKDLLLSDNYIAINIMVEGSLFVRY